MRSCFSSLCLLSCLTASYSAYSQTAISQTPTPFQQQAQAAVSAGKSFSVVNLTATVEWTAGSFHKSGTAQLQANVDGSANVQLALGQAIATAFSHGNSFRKIVLTGDVTKPFLKTSDSGTVTLTANADGSGSADIQLSNSSETENFPASGTTTDCGVKTSTAAYRQHNSRRCLGSTLWYLPQVGALGLA